MKGRRVVLIVLDSVGIGELPDAHQYNDIGSNTLGNIAKHHLDLQIPNLISLGLGNIDQTNLLSKTEKPTAAFGKAMEQSAGKDTTTGHWEIAGTILKKPFPVFKDGFPIAFIKKFESVIGIKTIGNYAASGTDIINKLGDLHVETKYPIIYTSADSVFQIAMHEDIYPIDAQYKICEIARAMLVDNYEVGRVISRPFVGKSGNYERTSKRKDFSVIPPPNMLDAIESADKVVYGIGKIYDIFAEKGITKYTKTSNNIEGINATIEALKNEECSLIFTNLVDFDMLYGHRRDIEGYGKCLMEFDQYIPEIIQNLRPSDLLIVTADHGNDPSAPGSDHTREYIPILCYGHKVHAGTNIGIRNSFSDIAATICDYLGIKFKTPGKSFLKEIKIS